MLNIAVIGCGRIAQNRHLPEYAANPDARICAVYDRKAEKAESLAQKYGAKAYRMTDELLASSEIDAVSICTANVTHAPLAIEALKSGKHVLCEKPMANTWQECEQMLSAAAGANRRLLIAHNQRTDPVHQKAREVLLSGTIGHVLSFHATFGHSGPDHYAKTGDIWFFKKHDAALGVIADLGVHKLDLIRYLLNDEVKRISAMTATLDKRDGAGALIDVDDNALCLLEMGNGAIGTITASWTYYSGREEATVIYGTQGSLHIYEKSETPLFAVFRDGERRCFEIGRYPERHGTGIIDEFVSAIRDNRSSILDASAVAGSMKAVFAANQSAQEGITIQINPF